MPVDSNILEELHALVDFFADCRRDGFAAEALRRARRFLELDRALAEKAIAEAALLPPPTADVCGVRVALHPVPKQWRHPASAELFGLTEDDEVLDTRVSINLRASVAQLYLSECAGEAPDQEFLAFTETYLSFGVYHTLASAVAFEECDACCLQPKALLSLLLGLAEKEAEKNSGPEARACFALAVFACRDALDCLHDDRKKAAAFLDDDAVHGFFLSEVFDTLGSDVLKQRIQSALPEAERQRLAGRVRGRILKASADALEARMLEKLFP